MEKQKKTRKGLSPREHLFCVYYAMFADGTLSAAKAGYKRPEWMAARLLRDQRIKKQLKGLEQERKALDPTVGLQRIAMGSTNDAIRLVTCEDPAKLDLRGMDLFHVSGIKRDKGGGIELKFYDRMEALRRWQESVKSEGQGKSLLKALATIPSVDPPHDDWEEFVGCGSGAVPEP